MMLDETQLKDKLQALAQTKFRPAADDELAALIPDMLLGIGSTDESLRDDLIYTAFAHWILGYDMLSPEQLRDLLQQILGDRHMFYGIGEANTDSVFRRSFSVLLLPLVLIRHRARPFLTQTEILQVKEKLLCYLENERDRRGFVNGKGWAHAVAHTADALDDLVQCAEMGENDLRDILEAIHAVIGIQDAAYTCGEEERMVTAVIAMIKRRVLPDAAFTQWIQDFAPFALRVESMPHKIVIRTNIKNFLQSLYFRLRWEQLGDQFDVCINQTLFRISLFTNQAPG